MRVSAQVNCECNCTKPSRAEDALTIVSTGPGDDWGVREHGTDKHVEESFSDGLVTLSKSLLVKSKM